MLFKYVLHGFFRIFAFILLLNNDEILMNPDDFSRNRSLHFQALIFDLSKMKVVFLLSSSS